MEGAMPEGRPMKFVVFACPKSGTTWVQRLLSAHPELHCAESRPFGDCLKVDQAAYATPHVSLEKYVSILCRHLHASATARDGLGRDLLFDMLDTIGRRVERESGKPICGEKLTPFAGTERDVVRSLHEYNPGLAFANLIRDGRDVLVSAFVQQTTNAIRRADDADRPGLRRALDERRIPDEFIDLWASMWAACVDAGIEGERRFGRSIRLRYEDLLDDPGTHAGRLIAHVGADADPAVVRACLDASSFERLSRGRSRGEEDRASFFRKGVSGDWVNWLTPSQHERFLAGVGDRLERAGYAVGAGA